MGAPSEELDETASSTARSRVERPARDRFMRRPVPPVVSVDAHAKRSFGVVDELADLLPEGRIRAGSVVAVRGSTGATSLALLTVARSAMQGSWVAVVGIADLGIEAASELGLPLERVVLISRPTSRWVEAVAVLLRGVDVVVLSPPGRCSARDARRMAAIARERGSLLVVTRGAGYDDDWSWPVPADVTLEALSSRWGGLDEGHGTLCSREIAVRVFGRRAHSLERRGVVTCGF